jgi:hypothetical protein
MKKLLFILCVMGLFLSGLSAQTKSDDTEAILKTVLNYIEGWETGDSSRMALSLHQGLTKHGIVPAKSGYGTDILNASYQEMVNWTVYQKGNLKDHRKPESDIKINELGRNIASVTCISKQYIDYLHLARTENGWKILNAIWEPNYTGVVGKKE